MKKAVSMLVCVSAMLSMGTASALAAENCYPVYTGKSVSVVDALKSLGIDSSFANRTQIAKSNGISGFNGSPAQNTYMLALLKKGELRVAGAPALPVPESGAVSVASMTVSNSPSAGCYAPYTGSSVSIVDALKCLGIDSGFSFRAKIAAKNGISGYTGTAYQNLCLLDLLKKGQLKQID